jgi:hypothetical protein
VEHVRRDFRLTVDLNKGEIAAKQQEILVLAPGGPTYYRDYAGALRPVDGEGMHSGDLFVITGLHPHLADAKQVAAAELRRRGERLIHLAERCEQIEESTNV